MRALRVDKLTLAALEGTLLEYRSGRAATAVPVAAMIAATAAAIEARADALAERLRAAGWAVTLQAGASAVGGGSAPGVELPTVLMAAELAGTSAETLERRLRALEPPVVARIESDRVVLDLRTVLPEQDEALGTALAALTAAR